MNPEPSLARSLGKYNKGVADMSEQQQQQGVEGRPQEFAGAASNGMSLGEILTLPGYKAMAGRPGGRSNEDLGIVPPSPENA